MIEGNSARFRSSEREQVQMRIVPAMAASSVKMKMGVKIGGHDVTFFKQRQPASDN